MFTQLLSNFPLSRFGRLVKIKPKPTRKILLQKLPRLTYVNASGLSESSVLAELYNNAKPLGMGIFSYKDEVMSSEQAEQILIKRQDYVDFDCIHGRSIETSFEYFPDIISNSYDTCYGVGKMQQCIDNLRNGTPTTTSPRKAPNRTELQDTLDWLNKKTQ
jgi:hypothetical protein